MDPKRSTTGRFVVLSLAASTAIIAGVIVPRVGWMNDHLADDGNPVAPFALLFTLSIVTPLAAFHWRPPWLKVAKIQAGAAVVACASLFWFRPSGDGLYMLPIAAAAVGTFVASVVLTTLAGRGGGAGAATGQQE